MYLNFSINYIFFFMLGGVVGYFAWGWEDIASSTLSLSLLLLYLNINNRSYIMLLSLGYYLAASRGLLIGTINYYDLVSYGFFIWIVASVLNSLAWWLIWSEHKSKRYYLLVIVIIVMVIPPIGFINWVNPLLSAGFLFSGWGWYGFLFVLVFVYGINYIFSRVDIFKMSLFFGVIFVGFYLSDKTVQVHQSKFFHATNTNFGETTMDHFEKYQLNKDLITLCNECNSANVLLPENAIYYFNEVDMMIWGALLDQNKSVFIGSHIINEENPKMYDNVLLKVNHKSWDVVYRQRVPVPVSMWKIFSNGGAKANLFSNGFIDHSNSKVGVLICYEQLIAMTYIHTLLSSPDSLVGISNLWWAKGTSIKAIEFETMKLWAILFNIPFKFSYNQ